MIIEMYIEEVSIHSYRDYKENGLTDAYNSIVGKQAAVDAENAKIEAHNAKLAEEVAKQQALADAALQAGDYMEIDAINNYILTELQPKEPIDLVDKMTFKDFSSNIVSNY